jgi:hypothetical protein
LHFGANQGVMLANARTAAAIIAFLCNDLGKEFAFSVPKHCFFVF